MPIRRLLLYDIYEETKDHDLVLTPNPLADAINRRTTPPRIGIRFDEREWSFFVPDEFT